MTYVLRNWETFSGTGLPVVGATVEARVASLTHPNPAAVAFSTTTDANGMWQFSSLVDGVSYDVKITYSGKVKWIKGLSAHNLTGIVLVGYPVGDVLLAKTELGGTGDIDFNLPIPAGYAALELLLKLRGSAAVSQVDVFVRFNGDTGANYHSQLTYGFDASVVANPASADARGIRFARAPGASATADRYAAAHLLIPDYDGGHHKSVHGGGSHSDNNSNSGQGVNVGGGTWASLSAITRVTIRPDTGQWGTGSRAYLYARTG